MTLTDLHICFLNKRVFLHFCWLELLHKYVIVIVSACVIVSVTFGSLAIRDWTKINNRYQYLEEPLVIHAMGKINDDTYTNSLEAFEYHYQNKQRVFEVDFSMTSDGKLVARHDWGDGKQDGLNQDHIPTEKDFLQNKICGKYTPLSLEELIKLMQAYEDIIIVTDTKGSEPQLAKEEISILINTAKELGAESVLERMVIQIYTKDMFEAVENLYDFPRYIFTLYAIWDGSEGQLSDICRFCKDKGIKIITMPQSKLIEHPGAAQTVKGYGIELFVHTVNTENEALEMLALDVDGIYTDDEENIDMRIFEE